MFFIFYRFEAKHAIAARFASICCNFKFLPLTVADIHQISHAADLMDMVETVRDEIKASRTRVVAAGDSDHFNALREQGLLEDDVLKLAKYVIVGGFEFQKGLYVTLPFNSNDLPMFGCVLATYLQDQPDGQTVLIVTEDWMTTCYDTQFGAYRIEKSKNPSVRAFFTKSLPAQRPMTAWTPYNTSSLYLSPRTVLTDIVFSAEDPQD